MSGQRSAVSGQRTEPDPFLLAQMKELIANYGEDEVKAAWDWATRRHANIEATRGQKQRLAELIDKLCRTWPKRDVFAFLGRQSNMGIPVDVSLEVLERVLATKHPNPWALVNKIMAEDYPGYRWGR